MCAQIKSAMAPARASSFPAISPANMVRELMIGLLFTTSSLNAEAYSSNSSPRTAMSICKSVKAINSRDRDVVGQSSIYSLAIEKV